MKQTFLIFAVLCCSAIRLEGGDLPLSEDFGFPLRRPGVNITWNATLDSLPNSAMVFRVVSKEFSATTISNLLDITGLSAHDRTWRPGFGNRMLFRDRKNENRSLCIIPNDGWVFYQDPDAEAKPNEAVEGVPSEERGLEIAEAMALKLGIDRRELAKKPGGQELYCAHTLGERGAFDKAQRKVIKTVTRRGVWLVRRIDGIVSGAYGGNIYFDFGSHGQLVELDWIWRALKPHHLCRVATRDELTDWIRAGQCVLGGWQELNISALNITNATPYYFEKREDEPQQYVYPFVQLDAQAALPDTNIPVRLYCPMVVQ